VHKDTKEIKNISDKLKTDFTNQCKHAQKDVEEIKDGTDKLKISFTSSASMRVKMPMKLKV
jgi:hypothetical protein